MNKKGVEFFEIPMWLVRMFYLILAMISVIMIISFFIVIEVNVQRVDAEVLAGFMYYSPNGLAYVDKGLAYSAGDLGRIMPGTVNSNLFPDKADGTLAGIKPGNPNINGVLISTGEGTTAKKLYYNKDIYASLDWLATASAKGGPEKVIEYRDMLFVTPTGSESRRVKIEAVTENT